MLECRKCGARLDLTMASCPACGAEAELGRLTGILGVVCRSCDAYNDPGAKRCASCGKVLGQPGDPASAPPAEAPTPGKAAATQSPSPAPPPPPGSAVIRSFPKGAGPQTRYVPFATPASETPSLTPVPLVTHCPRCGEGAGPGQFCARCGQPLGQRGTQVMLHPPPAGRTATKGSAEVGPGRARLVLERGAGLEGATFRLAAPSVEAGRSKGTVVFPEDPCLASHHATFLYRDGALQVRDEGAPGGVFVRLRGLSVPLRAGDVFALGDHLLRYAGPLPSPAAAPPDGTRRVGAPRPPGLAIVVEELLEGGVAGRTAVRGGPSVTIGRTGCAVNLGDDPFLSQAHAEILVDGEGSARLRDLGSSNGTYVRIPPHAERELRDGDCLRMGREVLRVAIA